MPSEAGPFRETVPPTGCKIHDTPFTPVQATVTSLQREGEGRTRLSRWEAGSEGRGGGFTTGYSKT
jgi:hypothetical protein